MEKTSMKNVIFLLVVGVACAVAPGCGDGNSTVKKTAADSIRPTGAPDNNSANNPSLADTNYESNRTKPMTDTTKKP